MTADQIAQANLASFEFWERDDRFKTLARLRRERPVHWSEHADSGEGFWSILRAEDITAVSRDMETFTNTKGARLSHDGDHIVTGGSGTFFHMDPPQHSRYRAPLAPRFTPRSVAPQHDSIRETARRIVEGVASKGEIDFVWDVANVLPTQVVAQDVLGVPSADLPTLQEYANRSMGDGDPEVGGTPEGGTEAALALKEYGRELARKRQAEPGDDLISHLCHAEVEGVPLPIERIGDVFSLTFIAGTETTRNAIAHGLLAFTADPTQRALFMEDPAGRSAAAAQEIVRWSSPFLSMRRTVTKDTAFGGVDMKAGHKVALWYASGTRDEAIIENGDDFDITRKVGPWQAFGGGGAHFCLGQNFALAEIAILFEELFAILPDIRASDPVPLRSTQLNGLKSLTATFTPRR